MSTISFFASSAKIPAFKRREFRRGVEKLVLSKKKVLGKICYVFCTDEELLSMNKKHLRHNTYTDIITFDYSSKGAGGNHENFISFDDGGRNEFYCKNVKTDIIAGDIFISVERVKENSRKFGVTFKNELLRVMLHGVLHLLGLKDKTPAEEKKMRAAEEWAMDFFRAEVNNK
jgi:rRNA maturation RNase YbeY